MAWIGFDKGLGRMRTTGILEPAAMTPDPPRHTSTWGGGSGFTVIYGVAAPERPPRTSEAEHLLTPLITMSISA
jgi:hypothetical protein